MPAAAGHRRPTVGGSADEAIAGYEPPRDRHAARILRSLRPLPREAQGPGSPKTTTPSASPRLRVSVSRGGADVHAPPPRILDSPEASPPRTVAGCARPHSGSRLSGFGRGGVRQREFLVGKARNRGGGSSIHSPPQGRAFRGRMRQVRDETPDFAVEPQDRPRQARCGRPIRTGWPVECTPKIAV